MPGKHAKFSPSSSESWLSCSQYLEKNVNEDSVFSIEGTDCHEVAELCLVKGLPASDYTGQTVGQTLITAPHAEAIQEYLDVVNDAVFDARKAGRFISFEVEVKSKISNDCWGTCDSSLLTGKDNVPDRLDEWDLKMGVGVHVEAVDNTQLLIYAIGIIKMLGSKGEGIRTVGMHIVQPRDAKGYSGPLTWEVSRDVLKDFYNSKLKPALDPSRPLQFGPSAEACKWCSYSIKCKALAEYNLDAIRLIYEGVGLKREDTPKDMDALTLEDVSRILPRLDSYSLWVNAINAYAFDLAKEGNEIPGMKLIRGSKHEHWINEDNSEMFLKKHFKIAEMFTKKLISPSQAKKLIVDKYRGARSASKKEVTLTQLESYKIRPKGDLKLVAESARGTPLLSEDINKEIQSDAARGFLGVELGEGLDC